MRQIIALAIGILATWFVSDDPVAGFWADEKWDVSGTVLGGMLAFNGILLAVGWNAFSKIHDIIREPGMAAFLKRHDILDLHMMFVDASHLTLAAAALASFAALVGVLLPLPLLADKALFAFAIATSVNSIVEAFRATEMMNDLIWDQAHSDDRPRAGQPSLRTVGDRD